MEGGGGGRGERYIAHNSLFTDTALGLRSHRANDSHEDDSHEDDSHEDAPKYILYTNNSHQNKNKKQKARHVQ